MARPCVFQAIQEGAEKFRRDMYGVSQGHPLTSSMLTRMVVAFEDDAKLPGDIVATPSTQASNGKSDAIIRTRRLKKDTF